MFAAAETGDEAPNRSQGDLAFDAWLHASLRGTYGIAEADPLPDALLRLCETAREGSDRAASS